MFSIFSNIEETLGNFFQEKVGNIIRDFQHIINMSTQTHNIIDPTSFTSIVRNPTAPVCCPIPNGNLQLGTLITIYGAIHSNGRGYYLFDI